MKLIYKGKFDGNTESLPHGEHKKSAVKFREADDPAQLGKYANIAGIIIMVLLCVIFAVRSEGGHWFDFLIGGTLTLLILFPHEIIHGLCFKETVYLYTNFSQGMLFVTGPETMSKSRFVIMSLAPNIVFGFLPYVIAVIYPSLGWPGYFGAVSIGMGVGDYYNVFNALTQMPKGSRTYLCHFNSYWYMPEREYKIREMKPGEVALLEDFLYEAIFLSPGTDPPPRSIIGTPELRLYISDFGSKADDRCFVAEASNKVVGAVWVRIMDDYGHVDDETPSLAISLYKDYRDRGIGTALMEQMLAALAESGYEKVSLSVQKANYAAEMYRKLGFEAVKDTGEEWVMVKAIQDYN